MIQQIETNDNGFTGIWSNARQLECGTLFLNPQLPNDVFFDKLTSVTCVSEKMIDESVEQFRKNNSSPYIYSLNYPEFDDLLKRKGFVPYDIQHVLKKRKLPSKKPKITKISFDNINLWTKVFCEAYNCQEWTEPVNTILENSMSLAEYFVDDSYSSCMVLYEKNSILGLYCLGTMQHKRKQRIAASMIDFALYEVNDRKLDFLMLETYERDNLMNFYSKLGFEKVYHKTVYTI